MGAIGCDSGNVEVQGNKIKECVLDTIIYLVGKVEKSARKPWITQEMISKMDERMKWKNVNTEEGRKNCRRLKNELKRATDNAKKEYLENVCNEIIPYPTAFPYGNGMVLHFYQQQESSTTKTVHKVINKGLKAYV